MHRMVHHALMLTALAALAVGPAAQTARAATGCTLNDPDRDIMRIFPDATSYRTEFIAISDVGGDTLAASIEERLGDVLDPTFEAVDLPYAYYTVLKGEEVIGRVHGVNQKGMFGGMQLILATDPEGTVVDFYYQKLASPEAKRFRAETFTSLFDGLTLDDFLTREAPADTTGEVGPVALIGDPSEKSADDFAATLRGLTKNLLLLNEFMLRPAEAEGLESAREESKNEGN